MKEYKISKEIAEIQIESFYDYYDIDVEEMRPDQQEALDMFKRKAVQAIRLGKVEIKNEDGLKIHHHTEKFGELVYGELTVAAKSEGDKADKRGHTARMCAILGSLCGKDEITMMHLSGKDFSVAEAIGLGFLSV